MFAAFHFPSLAFSSSVYYLNGFRKDDSGGACGTLQELTFQMLTIVTGVSLAFVSLVITCIEDWICDRWQRTKLQMSCPIAPLKPENVRELMRNSWHCSAS